MSVPFLRQPGRAGPFGALVDEMARAALDFCRVAETFGPDEFVAERPSDDPDGRSPRAICLHTCWAARGHLEFVRRARERPSVPEPDLFSTFTSRIERPSDVRPLLAEQVRFAEDTFEGVWDMTDEQCRALERPVRWGPRYDPEMMMEHTIVHLLRHRRQLERWRTPTGSTGGATIPA
jgi:hypothetical protein